MTYNPKKIYDFELEKTLDERVLVKELLPALEKHQKEAWKSMSRTPTVHLEQFSDQKLQEDIRKA